VDKVTAIATKLYGAAKSQPIRRFAGKSKSFKMVVWPLPRLHRQTQYSFSTDASLRGAPSGHEINIREVRLAAGAEFVVMVCGRS